MTELEHITEIETKREILDKRLAEAEANELKARLEHEFWRGYEAGMRAAVKEVRG